MQPVRLLLPALHRPGLAVLLLGVLVACPGDDDDDDQSGDIDCALTHDLPLEIAIGTGNPEDSTFEPLPDDGAADLFPGAQGGYHVYMQIRARGLCPNRVLYTRKLREPGGTEVIRAQTEKIPMIDGGDGWWVLPRAQPTFVCPSNTPGVAMAGRDIDLEVTLAEDLDEHDAALPGLADGNRTLTEHLVLMPTCSPSDTICSETYDIGCAAPPP